MPGVCPVGDARKSSRADAEPKACRAQAEAAVGVNGTRACKSGVVSVRRGTIAFVDQAVESPIVGSRDARARAPAPWQDRGQQWR